MRNALLLLIVAVFASGAFAADASTPMPLPQVWTGILEQPPENQQFTAQDIEVKILAVSSATEMETLRGQLLLGGQAGLRQAMFGLEQKAWIRIGRAAATSVGLVRVVELPDGGRRLRLVSDFPARVLDPTDPSGSTEHPFALVELTVGRDGKAEGLLVAAASITLAEKEILFESAGAPAYRIVDVATNPPLR